MLSYSQLMRSGTSTQLLKKFVELKTFALVLGAAGEDVAKTRVRLVRCETEDGGEMTAWDKWGLQGVSAMMALGVVESQEKGRGWEMPELMTVEMERN